MKAHVLVQVRSPRVGWRRQIGRALETWIDLQRRFYESVGQVAYCYSERANVSMLAAAAWCSGHIAIEEFATRKGDGWRAPGRIDLFLQIGGCALCVEAKAVQFRLPQSERDWCVFWRFVRTQLRATRHEAARASRGTFRHRVGVLFCVLSKTGMMQSSPNWIREFADKLNSQAARQTMDFLAAYIPIGRLPAEQRRHPGVILAGSATRAARPRIRLRATR